MKQSATPRMTAWIDRHERFFRISFIVMVYALVAIIPTAAFVTGWTRWIPEIASIVTIVAFLAYQRWASPATDLRPPLPPYQETRPAPRGKQPVEQRV